MPKPPCPAITSAGKPCAGYVHPGKEFCPAHDPDRVEARKAAAAKAGSRKRNEIVEVKKQLRRLANNVLSGDVDRADASVCAQILGVWLKAADLQRKVQEQDELLVRIEELEAAQGRSRYTAR